MINAISNALSSIQRLPGCRLLFPEEEHIGCALEGNMLRCAQLSFLGTSVRVRAVDVKPLDSPMAALPITAALPTLATFSRRLDIELSKPREVDATYAFQLERELPYPLADCTIGKVTIARDAGSSSLYAFAARKADVENCMASLHLTPTYVVPKALALVSFTNSFLSRRSRIVVDIATDETTVVFIENGLPMAIRSLPLTITPEAPAGQLESYCKELLRVLLSFQPLEVEIQKVPLAFTGPVELDPFVCTALGNLLGFPVEALTAVPRGIVLDKGISPASCTAHAVPIGLALLHSRTRGPSLLVDLRQERPTLARYTRELATYGALCCLLALIAWSVVQSSVTAKREQLMHKYLSLLTLLDTTPEAVEARMASPTDHPSLSQLQERLAVVDGEIKQPPEEIALHPNVPRVSDVIAFLAALPQASGVTLEDFSYTMVKRPPDRYQVRVDLDISASTPNAAREFHDALLAPNSIVDARHELKWSNQNGLYKATFFLNDRTLYPIPCTTSLSSAN